MVFNFFLKPKLVNFLLLFYTIIFLYFFNSLMLFSLLCISFQLTNLPIYNTFILLSPSCWVIWSSPNLILKLIISHDHAFRDKYMLITKLFNAITAILIMLFYLFVLKGIIVEEIFDFIMAIEPKVVVFSLTKYLKPPLSMI